jgi:hypothetical protein
LVKGTDEYKETVIKANEEALKLLDTYKDLEYEVTADGLIIINEQSLEDAKKEQLNILKEAQRTKQLMEQFRREAESEEKQVKFAREELHSQRGINLGVANTAAATGVGIGSGAAIGAGLGMILGPAGAAVGALIGGIIGLGTGLIS